VLAVTIVLLALERGFGRRAYSVHRLAVTRFCFKHLFWFYSHPAVYIMILPAMGVSAKSLPHFQERKSSVINSSPFSSLAIAVYGFLVWGHHMFRQRAVRFTAGMVFSFLSYFVAIPSAVKVFNWTATLYKGSISYATPMLYAFGFIGLFSLVV
jgi:cytochrome c oxidase subunit 1